MSISPLFSFFFFLLIPPPPRSTLFPYTTLFRSRVSVHQARARRLHREGGARRLPHRRAGEHRRERGRHGPRGSEARDRKSTRLNSSHQIISYAVFCLKKKKKTMKHEKTKRHE